MLLMLKSLINNYKKGKISIFRPAHFRAFHDPKSGGKTRQIFTSAIETAVNGKLMFLSGNIG